MATENEGTDDILKEGEQLSESQETIQSKAEETITPELQTKIDEAARRLVQSQKDRRFDAIEKSQSEMMEKLGGLGSSLEILRSNSLAGLSQEEQDALELATYRAGAKKPAPLDRSNQDRQDPADNPFVARVLKEHGVDKNDPGIDWTEADRFYDSLKAIQEAKKAKEVVPPKPKDTPPIDTNDSTSVFKRSYTEDEVRKLATGPTSEWRKHEKAIAEAQKEGRITK